MIVEHRIEIFLFLNFKKISTDSNFWFGIELTGDFLIIYLVEMFEFIQSMRFVKASLRWYLARDVSLHLSYLKPTRKLR